MYDWLFFPLFSNNLKNYWRKKWEWSRNTGFQTVFFIVLKLLIQWTCNREEQLRLNIVFYCKYKIIECFIFVFLSCCIVLYFFYCWFNMLVPLFNCLVVIICVINITKSVYSTNSLLYKGLFSKIRYFLRISIWF